MKFQDLAAGAVVQVGQIKFVKIGAAGTTGPYLAVNGIGQYMQTWEGCASIPTPTGTAQSTVVTLTDIRDGKTYDVTKFADGNCWMLNNLAYGGDGVDGCAGKSAFQGCGCSAATSGVTCTESDYCGGTSSAPGTGGSLYGTWTNGTVTSTNQLYGDCRDAAVGSGKCSASGEYAGTCGYYYNWQAATQDENVYYNNSYNPTQPVQGICPDGWRLPTTAEFCNLDKAVYNKTSCAAYTLAGNFYQPNGGFGGLYSGYSGASGSSSSQGSFARYWSSSQYSATYAYYLYVGSGGGVGPQDDYRYKYGGFSVRCLKD